MKRLLALMICAVSLGVGAQGEYSLTVEEYAVDGIPGHTTYRVYVNVANDDDFLAAVYGDAENPLWIAADSGWYNHGVAADAFEVNPLFSSVFPEIEFDSFVAIGSQSSGWQQRPQLVSGTYNLENQFNASSGFSDDDPIYYAPGSSVVVNDSVGTMWFNWVDTPQKVHRFWMDVCWLCS